MSLVYDFIIICTSMILVMVCAIVVHELAHLFALRRMTRRDVKLRVNWRGIKVGTTADYTLLSGEQYRIVLMAGVAAGFVIVLFLASIPFLEPVMVPLALLYLLGCKGDFKKYWRSKQEVKE